jgi:hypothetical protein
MALPQKTVQRFSLVAKKRQSPSPFAPQPTQRATSRIVARSVGTFVPKLTRTAFEKFGFSTAALLTDWPQIVGKVLAETTSPDRIKWPKAPGDTARDGTDSGKRAGATLHLRVDPARALDVQYKTTLIIDRINAYFGYRAVADLRIIQTPVADAARLPLLTSSPPRPLSTPDPTLAMIADDGLRAALERMQSGMTDRRR